MKLIRLLQFAHSLSKKEYGIIKLSVILSVLVIVIGILLYQTISSTKAAIFIESRPESVVFIDGIERGTTPLELEIDEREVTIQLFPKSAAPLPPYLTKVKLKKDVKTIVRREFGQNEAESTSQIISFERTNTKEANIAVVTVPDSARISLDGVPQGVSPLKFTATPGEHALGMVSEGYNEVNFQVLAVSGYTVTAIVGLGVESRQ